MGFADSTSGSTERRDATRGAWSRGASARPFFLRFARLWTVASLFVLASCAPLGPRGVSFQLDTIEGVEALDPSLVPLLKSDPVVLLAMFHLASAADVGGEVELPEYLRDMEPEVTIAREQLRTMPPDVHARFVEQIRLARELEPEWNDVHYNWGYTFGVMGLSPERTFDILDGWEQFEHNTPIGKGLGLSMSEGAFGYLWDLEHGMAGYAAGAAESEEEAPTVRAGAVSEASPTRSRVEEPVQDTTRSSTERPAAPPVS